VSAPLWDAVVVGAGPAGSVAALELRRRGLEVLLVDRARFPRRKVCGGCLSPGAVEVLRASGLDGIAPAEGAHPLKRLRLLGWGTSAEVLLDGGWAISRDALDHALVAAAVREGVALREGAQARLHPPEGPVRRLGLVERSGETLVDARVVVAADGLGGALLRQGTSGPGDRSDPAARIGLGTRLPDAPETFEPGTITMVVADGGYVGLVRVEGDSLNVAAAVDATTLRRHGGPGRCVAALLEGSGLAVPDRLENATWRGTPPLTWSAGALGAERVFRVGDATGYVEPFTGEGMCWALAGARALAPIAAAAAHSWDPGLLVHWQQARARSIGRAQRHCRAAAWALRRPPLTRLVLDALRTIPALATPFVRAVSTPPTPFPGPTA